MYRPFVVRCEKIEYTHWLAGFSSGEASFIVKVKKSSSHRLGFQVLLCFSLTQHSHDEQLMKDLMEYLDCGHIYKKKKEILELQVEKFSDLTCKVIPFFSKNPIVGVKLQDFKDFCRVAELIKDKRHLTQDGLEQIRQIKAGMNKGRR